jgi:hypothetical protein
VLTRLELLEHELGLPAAEVEDPEHARGDGVPERGDLTIDEEMVVRRPVPRVGGRSDLDAVSLKNHADIAIGQHGPIRRLDDLDAGGIGVGARRQRHDHQARQ